MAMATRSDWEAAAEALIASERERLGAPLTVSEVDAYYRGELSEGDAARVRALLIYGDDEAPLTAAEVAEDRARLYARIAEAERQRRERWWRIAPLAAALLLAAWIVQLQLEVREARQPRIARTYVLRPLRTTRGPASNESVTLAANQEELRIAPKIEDVPPYRQYRVRLLDTTSRPRVMWSRTLHEGEPLEITLPRDFLGDGTYRLDVEGFDDGWQLAGRYAFRVAPR
jgi:hypothetical protein